MASKGPKTMNNPVPEAYQIGWVPFINTKIYLDSHPLIPRTETEYWVNLAISEIKKSGIESPHILDLCAGSGCIGVAAAKEIPQAHVDFVEIDSAHHSTIKKNAAENGVAERVRIFGGNLFENIHDTYDIIFSNPPYIDMALGRVEESVVEHEPALALYGGVDGLEIIDRVLAHAARYLNPKGTLYLEHEPEQVEHLSKHPLYAGSHPDQYGIMRYSKFYKA